MREGSKNVGEIFAKSSAEQREKIDTKKAKISALIRKNSEAIFKGDYNLENLLTDSGDFTNTRALTSFLFSQYGHTHSLLEVAKNLRDVDKISEPGKPLQSGEAKPEKIIVDKENIKAHFFKLLDNKNTKKAAIDELRLMIQNKQLPEEALIFKAFRVKNYAELKDSLYAQWELKQLAK